MSIYKRLDAASQMQVTELIELLSKLQEDSSNDNCESTDVCPEKKKAAKSI